MKKLSKRSVIVSFQPAPVGWIAYYVDREAKEVLGIPIALWALTETPSKQRGIVQEIRNFVSTGAGSITDYLDTDAEFLCLLGPTVDHAPIVRQLMIDRGVVSSDEAVVPIWMN